MAHTDNAAVIRLDKVRIDGGTQSRAALNESVVAEYAEHADSLPPVVVYFDGSAYWLADGFHRYFAAQKAGKEVIRAIVERGTQREAILHSVGANATHGLRRTNEDKRRAVQTLLEDAEWSEWSDRDIAKACGVTHPFVANVRRPEVREAREARRAEVVTVTTAANRSVIGLHPGSNDAQPDTVAARASAASEPPGREPPRGVITVVDEQTDRVPFAPGTVHAVQLSPEPPPAADDDHDSLAELVDELQAEVVRLTEEVRIAEQSDAVAEALKWRRATEHAQREQSRHMDLTRKAEARESRTMKLLMRCGKAVGVDVPDKIPAAVAALAKKAGDQ